MNNKSFVIVFSLTLSVLASAVVVYMLGIERYTLPLVPLWLCSVGLFITATHMVSSEWWTLPRITLRSVGILLIILLPILIRVLHYQPARIHGDDLMTASFSIGYHPLTANFFAGVPEGKAWVAKFPSPYFLFQKLFLRITGATVLTVKLSVLPYILIVSVMTFLIARMLIGPFAAVAAVILYAFMAISIYHETLGLHFISSTAAYMIFFYALLRAMKHTKPFWYAVSGIGAGACYLSYTSSYIALPVLLVALVAHAVVKKKKAYTAGIIWALAGFFVIVAPFLTYAIKTENYFVGRINQVSLLTGTWSANYDKQQDTATQTTVIQNNLLLSLRAFIQDGIGGHGGYTFNKRAFFDRTGLILFSIGTAMSLFLMLKKGGIALILLTILAAYITGVVLTIPPPAYHRLSLAFPFIAIISAVPFYYLARWVHPRVAILIAASLLAVYAGTNIHYVQTAVMKESLIEDAAIIRFINDTYPNRHIHIAAFPYFALEKIYPFFKPATALSVDTKYHTDYVNRFERNEPYLYIITLPKEFREQFINADTNGTYIPYSEKYGIFTNAK